MSYPMGKIGEYIDIQSGFAFKSKDFCDSGVPVIKIKNITPPSVSLEDVDYVSSELASKQSKFLLEYDDVLIAMTGSHINQMASVVGRIARVKYKKPSLLNQRVGKITVKNSDTCDLDYIYYYLSQDEVKIKLASKAGGAANQANISPSDIKSLLAPIPNIETQRRIASILSNYDNLIENNQKQIKLLEEAAQRLYREWFVDLRFPGHETVNVVDGVPEGWERVKLKKLAPIVTGKRDANFGSSNGIYPFFTCAQEPIKANSFSFDGSAVILAGNGDFNVKLYRGKFEAYQRTYVLIPADLRYLFLLYFAVENNMAALIKGASGSIIKFLTKGMIENISIMVPNERTIYLFNKISETIFSKKEILCKSIADLQEARDRLLPKLMSGELEVYALDHVIL